MDLAIVNGYIVHKAYHKNEQSRPLSHVKYMKKLHLQLCRLQASDMFEANTFGTQQPASLPTCEPVAVGGSQSTSHTARQVDEWRNKGTQAERCQRTCKVCSVLRTEKQRAETTTYFCGECSEKGPVFLCVRARRQVRGVAITCWDLWHTEWMNGKLIPVDQGNTIRMRQKTPYVPASPSTAGAPSTPVSHKRRRTTP
ncbi:hypothetical protein F444_21901 [Phytophthora nicotianae P1976]|nr:hypothetical protein F444_21901 [Phytophthora nicotianae P1976]